MLRKGKKRRFSKQIDKLKSESFSKVKFWHVRTQDYQLNYQYAERILNQQSHAEECKRGKERGRVEK